MNKYDIERQRQKELIESFNNSKSNEERQSVKPIKENFMSRVGVSKKEYSQLIKYYIGIDIENELIYDIYRYAEVEKSGKRISLNSMNKKELQIYGVITKACLVLG